MHECILQRTRESRNKHFSLRVVAKRGPKPSDEDARICSYRGFWIKLHFCEETEEVVVKYAVVELTNIILGDFREEKLHLLWSVICLLISRSLLE